jgi:DNA-binding SARP family transcriptional activator
LVVAVTGLRIQVLGRVRAWIDGIEVDLGPTGQRAFLGLLALTNGQMWSQGALVDAFWGERPPPTAANVLQTRVKLLRRLVEPGRSPGGRATVLRTAGDGYALDLPTGAVDATRFRDLTDAAAEPGGEKGLARSAELLEEALGLWHGPPLADVPKLAGHPKVTRWQGLRRASLVRYGEAMIALGAAERVLPMLEDATTADPLDEALHAWLIRGYQATGQPGRAVAVYQRIRTRLAEELGIDPGRAVTKAYLGLLRETPDEVVPRRGGVPAIAHGDGGNR